MPQLVYLAVARRDIADIAAFIERRSESREVAETFIDKITDYCDRIARLTTRLGRARPELGRGYRSFPFGNYVIFFRYACSLYFGASLIIIYIFLNFAARRTRLNRGMTVALATAALVACCQGAFACLAALHIDRLAEPA